MAATRTETDSFGPLEVPAERYWGAQTQRSIQNFPIGWETQPVELVRALGVIKQAAADVNMASGDLDPKLGEAIAAAAAEVAAGTWDAEFPLVVWQTGSGTQSNMNANEVISNRAIEMLGGEIGSKQPVHPNDHVNMSQSSNDTFPTAMHIAVAVTARDVTLPGLQKLHGALVDKVAAFRDIIKIGRTHTQDATPLTLGQEFGGYAFQVEQAIRRVTAALHNIYPLAQGGTAVGTGLNTRAGFAEAIAGADRRDHRASLRHRAEQVRGAGGERRDGRDVGGAEDGGGVALQDRQRHPAARQRAAQRPRRTDPARERARLVDHAGQGEPDPGRGADDGLRPGDGQRRRRRLRRRQGHFELNVYKPMILYNVLQAMTLLGDAAASFADNCVAGIKADEERIAKLMRESLMLVTALAPTIGYDNATTVAKTAHKNGTTLKEEAVRLGFVDAETFDRVVQPGDMIGPRT